MLAGQVVERFPGEWIDVRGELFHDASRKDMFDRMSGHTVDIAGPVALQNVVTVVNNDLVYASYPVGARASAGAPGRPSIRGRRVYVPLPLWFSRAAGSALPLIALQGAPVQVEVDVRPLSELYQMWDRFSQRYLSPANYPAGAVANDGYANPASALMGQFLDPPQEGGAVVDLRAQLECEYGFLDGPEARAVAGNTANVLVERCRPTTVVGLRGGSTTLDVAVNEPTKELVWIFRRSDAMRNNEWANLSNASPADAYFRCMQTATLLLNHQPRSDAKDATFFDTLQPFQHHTGSPRPGIHVWSFALHPERPAPSGALDMGSFASKQLQLVLNHPGAEGVQYQLDVFAVTHNFLNVVAGNAGIQFV